jgi:hypothetical protein
MDYTILLQGRIEKEPFELWIKNHKNSNVVLSIWEDEDLGAYKIPKKWKIVINQYPLVRFRKIANLDYQIITTLKGLYKVDTQWVIKMRCDEYWSNLDKIYDRMLSNPQKIVTGSMFFRKWGMHPFHCSDKILGGMVNNLIGMFESTLHNLDTDYSDSDIPEVQLGIGWLMVNEQTLSFKKYLSEINNQTFQPKKVTQHIEHASKLITKEMLDVTIDEFTPKADEIDWDYVRYKLIRWKDMLNSIIDNIVLDDDLLATKEIDEKEVMRKWFDIINIDELKPYVATRNFGGETGRIWYRDTFNNEEEDCLTDINNG